MITEPIFFEIPIYRVNGKNHGIQIVRAAKNVVSKLLVELDSETHSLIQDHMAYSWKYNEVVGYLNLYILGGQFRVEAWMVNKRRINSGIIKKDFRYRGKFLEKSIPQGKTSVELFEFILEQLSILNKRDFGRFFFDLSTFKLVGQFVNWNDLTEKLNLYEYPEIRRKYFDELE